MSGDPDGGVDRGDGAEAGEDHADGDDATGAGTSDGDPLSGLAERIRQSRSRREQERREVGSEESDPFTALERDAEEGGGRDEADPFAALEREVGGGDPATSAADGTGAGTDADPFDRMEVGDIEAEAVWESLDPDEGEPIEGPPTDVGTGAERVERDDPGAERSDHVVEKGAYCQRCRFLSAPPEVRCTHEGTEIVEAVDSERFRVRGCPMVAQGGAIDPDPDDA